MNPIVGKIIIIIAFIAWCIAIYKMSKMKV